MFNELVGENDGWPNLDWHDWKIAMKARDKTLVQYAEKQTRTAISWYQHETGKVIPGYEKEKDLNEYEGEVKEKINQAIFSYLSHIDLASGLKGSENFDRQYSMYREDLDDETIKNKYDKYEKKERAYIEEREKVLKK